MEQEERLLALEGKVRDIGAKVDAVARLVLRVFDFDGTPDDLIINNRSPTTQEKDRFRSAILYASEMFAARDSIKEVMEWVKEQMTGQAGHRESKSQLIRGLLTGIIGAVVGAIASHFLGGK